MKILFIHPDFPAQFGPLATVLGKDPNNEVVYLTTGQEGQIPGVRKLLYCQTPYPRLEICHYLCSLESEVLRRQYRQLLKLKAEEFVPDVVYTHSGWGPESFIKDIFPDAKLLCYFEWFYPYSPMMTDNKATTNIKNTPILLDLHSCDKGLTPTYWQRQQFPQEYHSKMTVLHDGIDLTFFRPQSRTKLVLPFLDLSGVEEIVTYVARGMEPYSGFPQFIEAVALLQQNHPHCHVVVVGEEQTDTQSILAKGDLDLSRLHFTGSLPYEQYLKVLQASSVYVYLTRPCVLSWSLLEAMATECAVVASRTAPVEEVIEDGNNGLLVDFSSPTEIAERIEAVLVHPSRMEAMRQQSRQTVRERFDLAQLLPKHLAWVSA